MKHIFSVIAMAAAIALPLSVPAENMKLSLDRNWFVQSTAVAPDYNSGGKWFKASVPSTAMAVLMANGVYPADLLDGDRYKSVDRSQFDVPWWWRTTFTLPKIIPGEHVELQLDGLSYRADVWLNGHMVASADTVKGPFRRFSIDITPYVSKENVLALKVTRAYPGEPNIGFVDWNPRPADESMGIFRPVTVHVTDRVAIKDPAVKSKIDKKTLKEAWLTVEATLSNTSGSLVKGRLICTFDKGKTAVMPVNLAAGETRTVTMTSDDAPQLHVVNPRLWWCNNMGKPEMYDMEMSFVADDGTLCDKADINFGIREIEDYLTADNQRGFRLNGKPVLLRGAGWTDDIFLRNDSARNGIEAAYVNHMNLNTVRFENIWGTSENIYDLCDRLGLLVLTGWSCHWEWENYLGSPCDDFGGIKSEADMDLIAHSFADQVSWLRNHPSIIAWFVGSDMLPRPQLERRYQAVLDRLDNRPCVTAAKEMTSELSGPSGTKMAGPYDYVAPNYWYDPKAPGGNFGWNTETCIGAQMPQKESLIRMIPHDSIWPISEAYSYHCTKANDMDHLGNLMNAIEGHYGAPASFDDFVRKAELVNYDGTRTMFEAFRAGIPRATGIIQWMLNSAWPSLYWQMYDHYLVPTSAYYSVRNSNSPVQLIYDYGKKAVVAVNETNEPSTVTATMKRYGLASSEPAVAQSLITVKPYEVVKVFDVIAPEDIDFMFLSLTEADGSLVAQNFYLLSADESVSDWEHSEWYMTRPSHYADFKNLAKLKKADVDMKMSREENRLHVELHNKSRHVAFFNRLAAKNMDGTLIVPAFWDDNYISLEPGETRTLTCELPVEASDVVVSLDGWNTDPISL